MAHVLPGFMQKHSPTISRGPVEEEEREGEEGKTFRRAAYFLQQRLSLNRAYSVCQIPNGNIFISQFTDLEDKCVFIQKEVKKTVCLVGILNLFHFLLSYCLQ